jgi:hypothetical protein
MKMISFAAMGGSAQGYSTGGRQRNKIGEAAGQGGPMTVTRYEVWRHTRTDERWAVRLEYGELTGVFGPLTGPTLVQELPALLYEEHPDDLEWFLRASDLFAVVQST